MPTGPWYFEDFEVGQAWTTQFRTITEADVAAFAAWSWDTNPVHTDVVSSGEGRFGQRIAHGLLGVSVAMGLVSRLGIFESCSVALLGIEEWGFVRPILIGDSVQCRLEITAVRLASSGAAGILERHLTLTNQSGDMVQAGRLDLLVSIAPAGHPSPG